MNSRGVLYVYWGNKLDTELANSVKSVEKFGYPYHIVRLPDCSGLVDKCKIYDLSPYDETLFLDTDTIVLDNIDYGFELAKKYGVAIAIAPACYAKRCTKEVDNDLIEYNTGVIFFNKNQKVRELFESWKIFADSHKMNDQTSFARAIYETSFNPAVLPQNWNLRAHLTKSIFGPIKIWHSRLIVPDNIDCWNLSSQYDFGNILETQGKTLIVTKQRKHINRLKIFIDKALKLLLGNI